MKPQTVTGRTACVYARLSRDVAESTSVEGQLRNSRHWADDHGVTITHELVDSGLSGGKERDRAQEALRLLRSRECSILIVDRVDRFGRRGLHDLVALVDLVDEVPGVLVVAVSDGLRSDSPDWSLRLGLSAVMARAELDRISARNRASAERLRSLGRWPGGPTPYGYTVAHLPEGGKGLEPYAEEAAVITEAAERLASGEPLFRIVKDFNSRGLPSPGYSRAMKSGRTPTSRAAWRTDALRRLLCSHTVRGYALDGSGDLQRGEDGLPVEVWPPILPEARWRRVRALLGADEREERVRRRRAGEDVSPSPFPRTAGPAARILSGVLRCGRCGRNMAVKHTGSYGGRPNRVVYFCPDQPQGVCLGLSVVADRVEEFVSDEFLRLRGDSPLLTPREVDSPTTVRLAEVTAAIADTGRAIVEHYTPDLGERMARLQAEREALERSPRSPSVVWEDTGETYRSRWDADDDTTSRRDLLAANVSATLLPSPRSRAPIASRVRLLWQPVGTLGHGGEERSPLAPKVTDDGDDIVPGIDGPDVE